VTTLSRFEFLESLSSLMFATLTFFNSGAEIMKGWLDRTNACEWLVSDHSTYARQDWSRNCRR
jgi:hypothetical protein